MSTRRNTSASTPVIADTKSSDSRIDSTMRSYCAAFGEPCDLDVMGERLLGVRVDVWIAPRGDVMSAAFEEQSELHHGHGLTSERRRSAWFLASIRGSSRAIVGPGMLPSHSNAGSIGTR